MARPEGFEPPTNGFGSHYSIRLSYGRVVEPPRRRPVPGRASQRHEAVRDRHSIQFRRTNLPPTGKALPEGQEYPIAMADTPPHFAAVAGDAALAALLESDAC